MSDLEIPRTESGVPTFLVALVGPRDTGKTTMAGVLVAGPLGVPKERIIAAGPVPTIAERLGVPWYKVTRLDRKGADQFFSGLEQSDAHFFLALDEADSFLGASQYYCQPLQEWVRDNRNFGQGGLFIGHSIGEVAKSYLNNCDLIFFFRSSVPGTTEWLRKYAKRDIPGDDNGDLIADIVTNLGPHQALVWAPKATPKCQGIAKANPETNEIQIVSIEEASVRPGPTTSTPSESSTAGSADASSPAGATTTPATPPPATTTKS